MYPRVKNWSYNRLTKPHEVDKIIEIVNPDIVSIESNNTGTLIRPDGSNDKITFKKPAKKLEGKGTSKATAKKKNKVNFKESDEESDYEEPEEPRKRPAQRLLETIKNEKKEDINYSKQKKNPKKQMSDVHPHGCRQALREDDKKKIAELMKRLRG